ncbi:MAG TPA: asparagine synthase (glutamine-hydrolyzing) [Gemmataceae bacterium]|jgi:asparagine synthase (glutamine-hydrolysing)|nr:asparagine synthase (glutamine-hydrolyzing) [Gemmataceae bacterium]
MCGIAGIVDLRGRPVDRPALVRMGDRLAHRGPDAKGFHIDGGVGLGHRRLSIIDLAGGKQPMANADGTVWVTFNGEIYNFADLRGPLEARGYPFATHSDTEAIIHAYEAHGAKCVEQFRGMFAFAIWDSRRQRLFAARDRLGKKPFFYTIADGQFLFASEMQGLLAHPAVERKIDPTAIDDYLTYGYVPAPRTIFCGVFKLPPAHTLTLDLAADAPNRARPQVERYWSLHYEPKTNVREPEALEQLTAILTEAVRLRLVADVPLGALLSGGVDSSVVVALMSKLSSRPVKTFSIGFDDKAFNELPFARLVAERYQTEHHELVVRPDALTVLPTLVRHYGEPFADSSGVPSYYVAQLTRQHVTVALNGDGGDECFAGYDRYRGMLLAERYRRIARPLRCGLIEPIAALIPDSLPRRSRLRQAKRFLESAAMDPADRYLNWVSFFTPRQRAELYSNEFRAELAGHDAGGFLRDLFAAINPGAGLLDRTLAVDVQSYLPDDLLVKVDIATMANALEARSPLLDHVVMEFAARLPANLKIRGSTLKYLLRRLAERLLPAAALNRRKMGFGVPVGDWMRGELKPLVNDTLLSERAAQRGYLKPETVRELVDQHQSRTQDHTHRLWALLWLELWFREFID